MFTMSHKQCPMLFQNQKPHPKPHDKVPQRLKCHQDIPPLKGQNPNTITWYVPFLACSLSAPWGTGPPTSSRIYLSPQWATGDNASYNTSFACGLLALLSLAYTLKDLLFPPMGSREWCITQNPFCMWSFSPMGSGLTHTLKDLLASCKIGASNLTCHHKGRVITHYTNIVTKTG